ncbi:hypothetical protein MIR68_011765 [Amoeboaphelidium protococcarum]|nr:hypothetical protein MIR68_011765 [Amoeboaphelidium protococcarum]
MLRLQSVSRRSFSGNSKRCMSSFAPLDTFPRRHLGSNDQQVDSMLKVCGVSSLDELIKQTVPSSILFNKDLNLNEPLTEKELVNRLKEIASKNQELKSYIGMGYYNTIVPPVIQRNILENPQWYTQYTPYQPEIAQGRLESLLNFQTMVTDLTGMDIANASLLDEGTAAAEAMTMCFAASKRLRKVFFVDKDIHPQTIACVKTRADGFGINVIVGDLAHFDFEANKDHLSGIMIQYPTTDGRVLNGENYIKKAHDVGAQVCCATDLMALTLLKAPGEFGCDIAFGNSQRFGVPLGFGGPHAAFFACKDEHKRRLPGRLVGVSKDASGKKAYRLALQTREQHIRREKATSNICTAQALLANMSAMYAVYHGPEGLRNIARRIHSMTAVFAESIKRLGHHVKTETFFDTVTVELGHSADDLIRYAESKGVNLRHVDLKTVAVSFDETVTEQDLKNLIMIFAKKPTLVDGQYVQSHVGESGIPDIAQVAKDLDVANKLVGIPDEFVRQSKFMQHPVFNSYHSETEMLRYITRLHNKDLSLANAMIPLGSCTMKLNATTEMLAVTWPEFSNIHPFVPPSQSEGYRTLLQELSYALAEITGFDSVSLQPNSGAQGELAGLRAIKAYLESIGDKHRKICLIPVSAHGTNPASAGMAGMDVVVVKCDANGSLDMVDLKEKLTKHKDNLAAMMITYPSTYGVFDEGVEEICDMVHQHGGQVYLDGANLNAQVGVCRPADYGADVCHLNLHKTFVIPHGGGGPGQAPIAVKQHLTPFLPDHPIVKTGGDLSFGSISAAPFGSASILSISWAYIQMMGPKGLKLATQHAILNANYMAMRLSEHYKILFLNKNGMCAHEFIVDIRPFAKYGIEAIDVAKRLQDYGFHSPTMSWPVANTIMIEPTESESKSELDRFCDAMISIRQEIQEVADGKQPKDNNILTNAPHPLEILLKDDWTRPYSRERAAYPLDWTRVRQRGKFWPTVERLDDAYGDRNLICSCPPLEDYED